MSKNLFYYIDEASDAPMPGRFAVGSLVFAIFSCPLLLLPALRTVCGIVRELEQTYVAGPPRGGLGAFMFCVALTMMVVATLLPVGGLIRGGGVGAGGTDRSVLWTALVLALLWWPLLLLAVVGMTAGGRL